MALLLDQDTELDEPNLHRCECETENCQSDVKVVHFFYFY